MTTRQSPQQVSLFAVKWQPKKDQPLPWEIRQKLFKPKGGRNKKGDAENFHNRDYDFVSPDGEIFTGKGIRRFAQEHGLCESALRCVLNGRLHSYRGWTKAVGGRKLPVPPTCCFLSPSGEVHATTNLSEFARQHNLDPIALSKISRCIIGIHRGWRHCTPDGQPIVPPDRKHRKFTLRSPSGEIVEGSNLKAFAEQHGLSRTCLMNVLDGTTKEHRGWTLPVTEVVAFSDNFQEKLPVTDNVSTTSTIPPENGGIQKDKLPVTDNVSIAAPPELVTEFNDQDERRAQFKIGDRIEFLCDVSFGDIDTKAKNPNAKLAFTGESAEVCGVRGTRLAISIGGDPFDWPIRLVKKISGEDSLTSPTPKDLEVGDRIIAPNNAIVRVQRVDGKKITIDWGKSGTKLLSTSENDGSGSEIRVDDLESWNPAHLGEVPRQVDKGGQVTIFFDDSGEPPDPDDFKTIEEFEEAWKKWEQRDVPSALKFAYKQLRQRGYKHHEAIKILAAFT